MASDDWNPQYEEYDAEFNTLREEMDALGIGASFKPLIPYENWGRYRPSKRTSIVRNARRDNKLAIDRANKAAAEAAAASEAGSSQARPSGARPLEHPLTTRDADDSLPRAARRDLGGARPLVGGRARDGELAHGRRHASAAFEFAGAHPRQVRRAARPDEAARGLPHRVQQEGEFLRSCVCGWVLVACRASRARVGPRVCGARIFTPSVFA